MKGQASVERVARPLAPGPMDANLGDHAECFALQNCTTIVHSCQCRCAAVNTTPDFFNRIGQWLPFATGFQLRYLSQPLRLEQLDQPIDKHPDPRAQVTIGRVDDVDGIGLQRPLLEQRYQRPGLYMGLDHEAQALQHTQPRNGSRQQGIGIVDGDKVVGIDVQALALRTNSTG